MASYIVAVKDQEWSRLGERKGLDPQIWKMWQNVYHHILDLNPSTPRQTALRATLLADIRQISGLRRIRENASNNGLNPLFLFAALIGIVLTGIAYFTFIPNFVTLTLISIFGAYTGLVLFFIVAFSNPFAPPGNISPSAFKSLVAGEIQKLANSPSDRP